MSAPEHPPLCGIWVELDDISGDHPIGDCDCGIDGPRNEGWHGPKGTCPNPYCRDGLVAIDPNESRGAPPIDCRHPECPSRERRPSRDLPDSGSAGCLPVTQEGESGA